MREWIRKLTKDNADRRRQAAEGRPQVNSPTITGDWRSVGDHIENGIKWNIPACCIAFFICEWPRIVAEVGVAEAWRLHPKVEGCDYVVCPDCRKESAQ